MDLTGLQSFYIACCDLNGQRRGKRVSGSYATKLGDGGLRMPLSSLNVDLWGADIENSPLVFETGDADGVLLPTDRGAVPTPWLAQPGALVPMSMYTEDGAPFGGDPRHALAGVLDRYTAKGWRVMAATEMEFSLIDAAGPQPMPIRAPVSGDRLTDSDILSLDRLEELEAFFNDLQDACTAMELPAQSLISESGAGQFEMTLRHQAALRAADDAWLFKVMVKGLARKHGMVASFMAKPYAEDAGNGMHVHFSVLDADGRNVFDNGGPDGSDTLRHAVAGCLAQMPASSAFLAPHVISYDRLVPGSHAPTRAVWGYDNRTVAVRIPGGAPAARRIEHRAAGGDVNPYLVLAAILGAAIDGVSQAAPPPAPVRGDAYELAGDAPEMARDLQSALDLLSNSAAMGRILPARLIENFVMTKRQEIARSEGHDREDGWRRWINAV